MGALGEELTAVTKELEDKHPVEILKYLNDPDNVPNRHIKQIRFNRQMREEMRRRRLNAPVPESYIAGRSDEDITYVMPADEIVKPPSVTGRGLIDFWSRHHQETMADQQKLQQMKRNFDPNPKAISGPSGQHVVYVDISSNVVNSSGGAGNSWAPGGGMPPVVD